MEQLPWHLLLNSPPKLKKSECPEDYTPAMPLDGSSTWLDGILVLLLKPIQRTRSLNVMSELPKELSILTQSEEFYNSLVMKRMHQCHLFIFKECASCLKHSLEAVLEAFILIIGMAMSTCQSFFGHSWPNWFPFICHSHIDL